MKYACIKNNSGVLTIVNIIVSNGDSTLHDRIKAEQGYDYIIRYDQRQIHPKIGWSYDTNTDTFTRVDPSPNAAGWNVAPHIVVRDLDLSTLTLATAGRALATLVDDLVDRNKVDRR